jgi:hypothetical protein
LLERAARAAVLTAAATSVGVIAGTGLAHANQHEVSTFINGGHMAIGKATFRAAGSGMVEQTRVRVAESSPFWDTICNYNGQVSAVIPGMNGDQFIQQGSHHRGCSWMAAWKDFPNWDGLYPAGTGIRTKWISDATPGGAWLQIGVLRG